MKSPGKYCAPIDKNKRIEPLIRGPSCVPQIIKVSVADVYARPKLLSLMLLSQILQLGLFLPGSIPVTINLPGVGRHMQ